jgi:Cu-Zn family superoxide dismutase
MSFKPITAIAVFPSGSPKNSKITGTITFKESVRSNNIIIDIELSGLKPGKHGFHIHETGNLLDECASCKSHFNPFGDVHGGPNSIRRHVGDLGNIIADKNGNVNMKIYDNKISLRNLQRNIIGRSVVIHADEDDLGKGGNEESLKTGNAGTRIGCAVIGYANAYYH